MKAIIEKSEQGGFSVYAPDIAGAYGYGMTEEDAKADFMGVMEEQAEYYQEKYGRLPQWHDYSIDFSMAL